MNFARQNIFNLPDPQWYDCFVERFQSNFYTLRVKVERFPYKPLAAENMLEMVFTSVLFYEGTTNWTGASVCIATPEELLKMLYRCGLFYPHTEEDEIEETLETYHLFIILTDTGFNVKFIASSEDYTVNIIR